MYMVYIPYDIGFSHGQNLLSNPGLVKDKIGEREGGKQENEDEVKKKERCKVNVGQRY